MPSSVTHTFFALDMFDKLDKSFQDEYAGCKKYLKIFAQGPDPLNFYNLANLKKGKFVRKNYPNLIHTQNTQKFFLELIKYIKDNNLICDPQIIGLLYGFICHYVLDSCVHPFVIYKTGDFDPNNTSTYKYNGVHNDMELYIDAYFIYKRLNILPKDFKVYKFIFEKEEYNEETRKLLNKIFYNVYDIKNFSNLYIKSLKHMENIFKIFRYDKFGIKKIGYKFLDICLPKRQLKKEMLSYHINYKQKIHYLNLEKNEWNHPCDKYEIYNYSFIELYRIAIDKVLYIINNVNKYLYNSEKVDLKTLFQNDSYVTGKNCEDKNICQFFEY